MKKTVNIVLLLGLCMYWTLANGNPLQGQSKKILVIGLDTLQFSSNIFFIDELAHYNNVGVYEVVKLYNKRIMEALDFYNHHDYEFLIADSADKASIHAVSVFIELKNDFGEEFTGIAPSEGQGEVLFNLMDKYNADYVLSINSYQIFHKDPPEFISYDIRADHIIHYDIFNRSLTNIYGGQMPLTSYAVEANYMGGHYREFARKITLWLAAHEQSLQNDKTIKENFRLLQDEKYINASSIGLALAFDGPYGLLGGFYSRLLGRDVEVNAGLGYDFSGFKIGVGTNYYFHDVIGNRRLQPFIGLNYAFVTGNTFEMGGSTDDYGNQTNPGDVSKYKIHSDHTIHLGGGMSYWTNSSKFSLSLGYSFPFRGRRPEWVAGRESESRMNFVRAMNPGGLAVVFQYSLFINQRFLLNLW